MSYAEASTDALVDGNRVVVAGAPGQRGGFADRYLPFPRMDGAC